MPETVAVVGASQDPHKFSYRAIRAYQAQGFVVYPINPKGGEILGLTVFPNLDAVPSAPLDRISMYVPPAVGISLLPEISRKGCRELWLNPGSESPELVSQAEALGLYVIQACSLVALGEDPHAGL